MCLKPRDSNERRLCKLLIDCGHRKLRLRQMIRYILRTMTLDKARLASRKIYIDPKFISHHVLRSALSWVACMSFWLSKEKSRAEVMVPGLVLLWLHVLRLRSFWFETDTIFLVFFQRNAQLWGRSAKRGLSEAWGREQRKKSVTIFLWSVHHVDLDCLDWNLL